MNGKEKKEQIIRNIIEEYLEGEVKGHNKISIADFEVISSTASLKEVEETINRLIDKHKDFAEFRKQKAILQGHGVFG